MKLRIQSCILIEKKREATSAKGGTEASLSDSLEKQEGRVRGLGGSAEQFLKSVLNQTS